MTFVLDGLASGAVIALVGVGVVVIHRSTGVLTFAQGVIASLAAYLYFQIAVVWGWPVGLAAVLSVAGAAAIGAGAERAAIHPLRRADALTRTVATLGIVLVAQVVMRVTWGGEEGFVPPLVSGGVAIGGQTIGGQTLLIAVVTVVIALALWWWSARSLTGLALAATADHPTSARVLGIGAERVSLVSWTLAAALGGIAGVLVTPLVSLNPWQMTFVMVSSYAAALVGGFSSLALTLAGGLAIGVLRAAITSQVSVSGLSETIGFIAVFAVLAGTRGAGTSLARILRGEAVSLAVLGGRGVHASVRTIRGVDRRSVVAGAAGVAALAVPLLGNFWTFVATLAVVYALAGVSLVVLTGWSGQLNLHVAALGLGWGAYAAFALVSLGVPAAVAIVAAGALTVPFALVVGLVAVRFRGLELAVATLALGLTFERLAFRNIGSWLGSSGDGTPFQASFVAMPRPRVAGWELSSDAAFYGFALLVAGLVIAVVRNVDRGMLRRTLEALRDREAAAEVAGVPALRYRVGAFVGSIAVAGTAGALIAALKLGVAPDSFTLETSFLLLAAVVIGGVRTIAGGVFGGVLAAVLPELVRPGALPGDPLTFLGGERLLVVFAVGLVATLRFRPAGLFAPRASTFGDAPAATPSSLAATAPLAAPAEGRSSRPTVLRAQDVAIAFGGLRALDGVSLRLAQGEVCALIGPNGAGKSTLFNCLDGVLRPDRGRVYLAGEDVTDMPPHRRVARGLARTFQSVELFAGLTAVENVAVAIADGRRPVAEALALPASRAARVRVTDRALDLLAAVGLQADAHRRPGELPFGSLRRLEIAVALATDPRALLLDEPSAGLDVAESADLAETIAALRAELSLSVLLVEHDMAVVGGIADWVYVLDRGRLIAEGSPVDVRRDELVVATYLGSTREVTRARR